MTGKILNFTLGGGQKPFPIARDFGDKIVKCISENTIWNFVIESKIPEDIKNRVFRAVEWISHAITSDNLDFNLVNLCVALEILLLPGLPDEKIERNKGALIALRQVLVDQNNFFDPKGVLAKYKLRNFVVHGGYLKITSFSSYFDFLACCICVLEKIIRLSKSFPEVQTLKELITKIENKETLEKFIEYYKNGIHECREAKEEAERLLRKY